jgi:hypothetical protein
MEYLKNTMNNKGMALVATVIFVAVISTIGISMLSMTSNDIKLSALQEGSKEAFYIAESGLERAISYLEKMETPNFPNPTELFSDENDGWPELGEGSYNVKIESLTPMSYLVTSIGEIPWNNNSGEISTTIESKVALDNFALYAYFSDLETLPSWISYSGSRKIWFYGDDTIGGKLHSNDRLHIAGSPTFNGPVTSAYINEATGDTSWEAYDSQTDPTFNGGYSGGQDRIELPTYRKVTDIGEESSLQRKAAGLINQDYINSATDGVYVANSGGNVTDGIWVKGDVSELSLGTDSEGNSKITIEQEFGYHSTKSTTIYTVETPVTLGGTTFSGSPTSPTTVVYDSSTGDYTPYYGESNGVLFVNGEIESLKGTASDGGQKGKITIASNNDITITDDLLYNTRVDDSDCFDTPEGTFPDIPDSIGIVSEGNIVIDEWAPNNIEINAIMMALGTSFYYEGWQDRTKGTLTVHGSFIQAQRGPVGTFGSHSRTGYIKNYFFDTRMSTDNPNVGQAIPPYFPITGKYIKLYWKEL